ncbi:hypothetical protein JB92DRAFT_3147797 [Gautieria morchelliformis]|nr:hypothetical protein JB92DRAFT_3147797 [Gautieria morchelliformis]
MYRGPKALQCAAPESISAVPPDTTAFAHRDAFLGALETDPRIVLTGPDRAAEAARDASLQPKQRPPIDKFAAAIAALGSQPDIRPSPMSQRASEEPVHGQSTTLPDTQILPFILRLQTHGAPLHRGRSQRPPRGKGARRIILERLLSPVLKLSPSRLFLEVASANARGARALHGRRLRILYFLLFRNYPPHAFSSRWPLRTWHGARVLHGSKTSKRQKVESSVPLILRILYRLCDHRYLS